MFSHRTRFDLRTNELTRRLEERRAQGKPVLDLTIANPTQADLTYPGTQILKTLSNRKSLRYQPSPLGLLSARQAVCDFYRDRGQTVQPERLLLTSSTSETYSFLFKLLADPGDPILIPQPSYPLFQYLAALESLLPVPYHIHYSQGWFLDLDEIRQKIGRYSPKAILLVQPNNPTGSCVRVEEWRELQDLCAHSATAVICDEVFFDYPLSAAPPLDFASEQTILTFVLNGLSKTLALPQVKLSWLLVRGPERQCEAACQRLELISDTFLSVSTMVQQALPRLLELRASLQQPIQNRIQRNWLYIQKQTQETCVECLRAEAGWYAVLRTPLIGSSEDWVVRLLGEKGVLVHPGDFYGFDGDGFLVVSLLVPPVDFGQGLKRLIQRAETR